MKYEAIKDRKDSEFKRLVGVKKKTFGIMLDCLKELENKKKKKGRKPKLTLENQLLLCLNYLREYRTQYHLGASYGIHESNANRIIQKVENALMKSGKFNLPNKRDVQETDWLVVLVDATESPIERPKKTEEILLRQAETPYS